MVRRVSLVWALLVIVWTAETAPSFAGTDKPGDAGHERKLVAVVRAPDADAVCQEVVNRIIAELTADGTPVVALTCARSNPECVDVWGTRVRAVVLVEVRDKVRAVEVRAGDSGHRIDGKVSRARTGDSGGGRQATTGTVSAALPAVLAVRTVELVRAMSFDGAPDARAPESGFTPPHEVPAAATNATVAYAQAVPQVADVEGTVSTDRVAPRPFAVAPGAHNLTVNIGGALIAGFSGLHRAYGPRVSVGRRTSDHVLLSAVLAGPAFGGEQSTAEGRVSIRHEMAALEGHLAGMLWRRFMARVGVGGGLYHMHVDGQPALGSPLYTGRSAGAFAGLLSWSAGLIANLTPDLGVFIDARMLLLTPTPVVRLMGTEIGRASNPGLLVATGIEFRL